MKTDDFEYDPERALWRPGRRTFLFMLGGALAGTILPGKDPVAEAVVRAMTEKTELSAHEMVMAELKRAYPPGRLAELMGRSAPFRRALVTG